MIGDEARRAGSPRPLRVALVVALMALAPLAGWPGARRAGAQPAPERAVRGDLGTVEITVVGTPDDLRRIRRGVESRSLAGPGARWSRVPGFDPMDILRTERESQSAALRCWIDVLDPRRARLYFAARSGQQFLVRDVELTGAFDHVDRETLSQVIELSVSALLENERAGLTRAQAQVVLANRDAAPPATVAPAPPVVQAPPPPDAPDPAPAGPPHPFGAGPAAAVFYGARVLGADLPLVHGPGALLSWAGLGWRRTLGLWASGQYQLPQQEVGPVIGLRFDAVAARAGVQGYLPLGRGAATDADDARRGPGFAGLTGRLGAGVDLVRLAPRPGATDPSAMLAAVRWSRSLVLAAAVAATWTLGRGVALGATASVDVLPTAVHYDLVVDGQTSPVFSPWRVRPGLALELFWH